MYIVVHPVCVGTWLDYCGRRLSTESEGQPSVRLTPWTSQCCHSLSFTSAGVKVDILTTTKKKKPRPHAFLICALWVVHSFIWMCLLFSACGCALSLQSAWQTQGWAEVASDLCVQLKLEMLWTALFLEYAFKLIQNIQWSTGEHWPWLHLSFINFVSVKWVRAREWSDYVMGAEPFIRETHQPCDSGSLVPISHFLSVTLCERKALCCSFMDLFCYIQDNTSVINDIAAFFYCNMTSADF